MSKKRNKQDKPQATKTERDDALEGTEGQLTEGSEGSEETPAGGETSTTQQLDESTPVKQEDGEGSKEPEPADGEGGSEGTDSGDGQDGDQSGETGDNGEQTPPDDEPTKDSDGSEDDGKQSDDEEQTDQTQTDDSPLKGDYRFEAANIISRRINDYAGAMGPSQTQTPESIRFQQRELLNIFNTVLRQDEAFDESMKAIITTVRENRKGAFREHFVFRGMNRLGLGATRAGRFDQLINLFLAAADSKNPKEVSKVVDLKTFYTKYLKDDSAQSRLASYFGS